ncbi:MAG: ABC transporter permease, partial [Bacteroidota bacterium]
MLYNYLKIATRNLVRHRTFSLLNGVGLVLGTVCCLYMVLYVQGHYGYDQHHHEAENVYRVTTELKIASEGEVIKTARSSPPFAPMLPTDFPEIQAATRVCPPLGVSQQLLQVREKTFYIDPGYYVDSTFFQVFDFN